MTCHVYIGVLIPFLPEKSFPNAASGLHLNSEDNLHQKSLVFNLVAVRRRKILTDVLHLHIFLHKFDNMLFEFFRAEVSNADCPCV